VNISDTGIIILAAGASTRMGQSKQLLNVEGQSLLTRTVDTALNSLAKKIVVVLGANESDHTRVLSNLSVDVVSNGDWQKGMGSSIKTGLRYLMETTTLHAVIILVCDQPLLDPAHINKLITEHHTSKKPIVASSYAGTNGVPVLFEKGCFPDLLNLSDDQGAKKIIQQHPEWISTVSFPEGKIDLDTLEDYNSFLKTLQS
jgi:molybdenum cofactor cytidylyltransferase